MMSSDSVPFEKRDDQFVKANADGSVGLYCKRTHRLIRIIEKKIERNDPCPCQSGKKFKKCCMIDNGEWENFDELT